MDVNRAHRRNIQNFLREQLTERRRYAQIRRKTAQGFNAFLTLDAFGLKDRNTRCKCRFFHRTGGELMPAPLGSVRLTKDADHVIAVVNQRAQGRNGKIRRTHEHDSHALLSSVSSSCGSSSSNSSRDMIST